MSYRFNCAILSLSCRSEPDIVLARYGLCVSSHAVKASGQLNSGGRRLLLNGLRRHWRDPFRNIREIALTAPSAPESTA
jgi:hypothetical protein